MAGQQLITLCHSLDVEILDNRGNCRPNYMATHVNKPPAVAWLGRADKVSAVIAVTNKSTEKSLTQHKEAPG